MSKLREMALNSGGNIFYLACTWLMTVVVVRLADFEAAGAFSLAMTLTVVFYNISNYGIRSFQVSDVTGEYADSVYMLARIWTCALGFLLCMIYCLWNDYSLHQFSIIMLYMIYKSIEAFSDLSYGYFQKNNHFDYVCFSLCGRGLLTIGLFTLSLWLSPNLYLALIAIAVGTGALYFAFDLRLTMRFVSPLVSLNRETCAKSRLLLKTTVILMLINTMAPLLNAIPRVYFEAHTSAELYGYYFSISSPTVIISTFVGCVLLPLVPVFAETYQKNAVRAARYLGGCVLFTLLFGAICYGLSLVLGDFALALLYTDAILEYSYALPAIVWAVVLSAAVMCFNLYFIAIRKQRYLVGALIIGCTSAYATTSYLVDTYSMQGVSYTLIFAQGMQCLFMGALVLYDLAKNKQKEH